MSAMPDDNILQQPLNNRPTMGVSVDFEGFQAQAAAAGERLVMQ